MTEEQVSPEEERLRREWVCVKCGAHPVNHPQPTTDTAGRWRIAWCRSCDRKRAVFRRISQ